MPNTQHTFTDPQRTRVQLMVQQQQRLQETIQFFLSYVAEEAGLPQTPEGYHLRADLTGLDPNAPFEAPHEVAN